MKHLLLSEIFPPDTGGSGRWFWEIYRRLPGSEVVIAAGTHPLQDNFDRKHDLIVHRLPLHIPDCGIFRFGTLRLYLRLLRTLRRIVVTEGVSTLHCGRCVPEGWLGLMLKRWVGLPFLCYVHGEDVNRAAVGSQCEGVLSSRQIRWMTGRVLRKADLLIANSQNTADILQSQWAVPAHQICILHPGVDTARFRPAPSCTETRRHLSWDDRPVILTVGRLTPRKGQDQMIRALHAVRSALPDVLYAVVGDGPERGRLQTLARDEGLAGHVQFLGEIDDDELIRCYQQSDLFVLPNRQIGTDIEGFGMVLVEAQACGKPVVAGDSGGTAETMSVPETGRIVRCDEPGPLAELVRRLLSDPELLAGMGTAARSWAVEQFDWDFLSRRARELFQPAPVGPALQAPAEAVNA